MRLIRLTLRNFKKFREYAFEPRGADAAVYADNGVGKTSLADGLHYLQFDKDSLGRVPADAGIKPVNPDGTPKREGDTYVEGVLDLEPGQLVLAKTYREVWSRPRGSAEQVLSGHTTDHYIDGVPVKQKEYQERVRELCDEKIFRLLADPAAFMNDKVLADSKTPGWVNRRNILLEICGGVTDEEIYAAHPELVALREILGKRTIKQHRDVAKARHKAVREERERIPVRIDEATRALPAAVGAADKAALQTRLEALRRQRQGKEVERTRIQSGGQVAELRRRIAEIDTELEQIKRRVMAGVTEAIQVERRKLGELQAAIDAKHREASRARADAEAAERDAARWQARVEQLRADWYSVDQQQFSDSTEDTCPTCGRALPADQVQAARDKALADFNAAKSAELEHIEAEGKRAAAQCKAEQEAAAARRADAEAAEKEFAALEVRAAEIQARIERLQSEAPEVEADPDYVALAIERREVEDEITALQAGNREALEKVSAEIATLDEQIASVEADLGRIAQRAAGETRIEELKAQERERAAELEDLERQLYLMEQFELRQADLLEERVNAYFETVRWKLSERLINGGTEPCCVALVDGVPYGGGLNTAGEINAGLEIIDVLGRHYGFRAPVFCDRMESVVRPRRIEAQVIRLIVSARDKTLRVEREPAREYAREAV